jgi:hypothetical protein
VDANICPGLIRRAHLARINLIASYRMPVSSSQPRVKVPNINNLPPRAYGGRRNSLACESRSEDKGKLSYNSSMTLRLYKGSPSDVSLYSGYPADRGVWHARSTDVVEKGDEVLPMDNNLKLSLSRFLVY